MTTNEQLEIILKEVHNAHKDAILLSIIMICFVSALIPILVDAFYKYTNKLQNPTHVFRDTIKKRDNNTSNKLILYILETLSSDTFLEDMDVIMKYHETHKKLAYDQFKKDCIENKHCVINNAIKRVHMVYTAVSLHNETTQVLSDHVIRTLFDTEDVTEYLTYVLVMMEQKITSNESDKNILVEHRAFWEKYSINSMSSKN